VIESFLRIKELESELPRPEGRGFLLHPSTTCFGIGLCSLGFATSLVTVGFAVIFIGVSEGILMPTILNWIAAITPRQFLGGLSVALNLGQFASTLAIVLVITIVATYSNLFLAFGCVAFVLAVSYLLARIKEKYTLPDVVPGSSKLEM
jgi:MFS family permease